MNWLKKTYRSIVDHLTKVLGIVGAMLLGADATGYLEGIKAAALQYLPPDIATQLGKWIGITIFVAVILRGLYTGYKAKQKNADVLPPPDPSTVVKVILILCAIAIGVIAPRAYATDVHQFVHFTVYINSANGDPDHYLTEGPMAGAKCLKILEGMGGRQVKNGLAEVHFCRAVDAKGAPVPEIKINPETMQPLDPATPKEETSKVPT